MSDTEAKLNTEFDEWFAKVCEIAKCRLDPDDDPIWAELWFDGYTPQEAVDACNEEDE
jgi:hypothetical protein